MYATPPHPTHPTHQREALLITATPRADGSDGMTQRTIYVAHTNTGLEGLGEYSGPPAEQEILVRARPLPLG